MALAMVAAEATRPPTLLSSTATMAMGACGCSFAMRLSVATSVVNPLRSATASSSLSGSEPVVENGGLHRDAAEQLVEWLA